MFKKYIYSFGSGKAEGNKEMKVILGGKGANLAEMTNLGIPVPPGLTISTNVCEMFHKNSGKLGEEIKKELEEKVSWLEKITGKEFGVSSNPLLLSVRSGAAVSMPGMMDTILNLGMNDENVKSISELTKNPRMAWDSYRRLIQMYASVVHGIDLGLFENTTHDIKKKLGIEYDKDLTVENLQEIVGVFKRIYSEQLNENFPSDPWVQLNDAIDAVLSSWNNQRAIRYRAINKIEGLIGTAVNIQVMVFGNYGDNSGTGVYFSRNPSNGENELYGEYLMNAQGEDVVAGIRTPKPISDLLAQDKKNYDLLVKYKDTLELHFREMQDMEFTIEDGKLFILQARTGKCTGDAALKFAVDFVYEGLISKEEALMRVSPDQIEDLLHPKLDDEAKKNTKELAIGLNASPGAATGQIVFDSDTAEQWCAEGKKVLLVRRETSPDDIGGMHVAEGILTSTGGITSHAAVVARGMGTPCVCGCSALTVANNTLTIGDKIFKEGDYLTIDGESGKVYGGQIKLIQAEISKYLEEFLSWADDIRHSAVRSHVKQKGFLVRANADLPSDAKTANKFGAEGIGLCRTEHMFFDEKKLCHFQDLILTENKEKKTEILSIIGKLQQADFEGLFKEMNNLPVTIRLLDPPLHEFLPKQDIEVFAQRLGKTISEVESRIHALSESNPMIGHRGCRLGLVHPEIYDTQIQAIILAAIKMKKQEITVIPEIMIPLVGIAAEYIEIKSRMLKQINWLFEKENTRIDVKIGTMIELPRAALIADRISEHADFFSFGTNDLTQMTFGFSRDDVGSFLPVYLEKNYLKEDPFATIDQDGVGELIKIAVGKGLKKNSDLKTGICGEHGGEEKSIEFCYKVGLNYVSCSPFRVPSARLAASQAVLKHRNI
mgnify:CR=1 FL=1